MMRPSPWPANAPHLQFERAWYCLSRCLLSRCWSPLSFPLGAVLRCGSWRQGSFFAISALSLSEKNEQVRIPYCSNVHLSAPHRLDGIGHLVVIIHGSGYRARDRFFAVGRAAKEAKLAGKTIILAPQFLKPRHLLKYKLDDSHASWARWTTGGPSRSCKQCPPRVGSGEVLEQMVQVPTSGFDLPDLRKSGHLGASSVCAVASCRSGSSCAVLDRCVRTCFRQSLETRSWWRGSAS